MTVCFNIFTLYCCCFLQFYSKNYKTLQAFHAKPKQVVKHPAIKRYGGVFLLHIEAEVVR